MACRVLCQTRQDLRGISPEGAILPRHGVRKTFPPSLFFHRFSHHSVNWQLIAIFSLVTMRHSLEHREHT